LVVLENGRDPDRKVSFLSFPLIRCETPPKKRKTETYTIEETSERAEDTVETLNPKWDASKTEEEVRI
jgi:hypothetical protein